MYNLEYNSINLAIIIMQKRVGMVQSLVGENHPPVTNTGCISIWKL